MTKRDDILTATKELFWLRGYEATSPREIQSLSGAGQGSFYHHFHSKRELAYEAMNEVVDERLRDFDQDLSGPGSIRERIDRFLGQPRDARRGCRIGRMVWDAAVDDAKIRQPLHRYFHHVEERLTTELKKAVEQRQIELLLSAEQIALLIIAALQGGFTVSRAVRAGRMDDLVGSLRNLLDVVMLEQER